MSETLRAIQFHNRLSCSTYYLRIKASVTLLKHRKERKNAVSIHTHSLVTENALFKLNPRNLADVLKSLFKKKINMQWHRMLKCTCFKYLKIGRTLPPSPPPKKAKAYVDKA